MANTAAIMAVNMVANTATLSAAQRGDSSKWSAAWMAGFYIMSGVMILTAAALIFNCIGG